MQPAWTSELVSAKGGVKLPEGALRDRVAEFFAAHIRNPHTRRSYLGALRSFVAWCEVHGVPLEQVGPLHVAAYVEELGQHYARPTVKQRLAALRMIFDWLVVGQVLPRNPVSPVRGPRYRVEKGKTPVLQPDEMRQLLQSLDPGQVAGLRDRALCMTLAYTFARIGAVLKLRVDDVFVEGRRLWLRLSEKGGKEKTIPCHHALEACLDEYLTRMGLWDEPRAPLFPSVRQGQLTRRPLAQANVHAMIRKRCRQAGIQTRISCHSFRATGITTYLSNGGKLEVAQRMAGHASPRTTSLYDRRNDRVDLDEVERIVY